MTADVDITVDAGELSAPALAAALAEAGFALRFELSEDFLQGARILPLSHSATAMPVDLMLASTRLHAELLSRRKMVNLGSLRVPMLSPEDLIVTKVLAGRRKDMEDVEGVLSAQPALNVAHIRELLSELSAALGEDRLLRRFERLVRRSRSS